MYPDIYSVQLDGFSSPMGIHTYGLMLLLAFGAAFLVAQNRVRRIGTNPDIMLPILGWAILLGIVGSRVLHFVMAEPHLLLADPLIVLKFNRGGMAFYGGVIAATFGCLWIAKKKGAHLWKFADATSPAILVGLALGRLGCFAAGCCHGRVCDLPSASPILTLPGGQIVSGEGFPWLALVFEPGVGVGNIHSVPVFPTQLWESTGALLVFALLSWMWAKKRRFDGQILGTLLILYPILRSTIETFRGDTLRGVEHLGLFSTSQLVSIPVACLGLTILAIRSRHGLQPETPWVVSDDEMDELLDDLD